MNASVVRRLVSRRPYRPLVLHTNSGERIRVPSPEIIVTDTYLLSVDETGLPIWIDNNAIATISHARRGNGRGKSSSRG